MLMLLRKRGGYNAKVLATAPANLLAYWALTETSGTAIVDSSGNGRNGVYTGVDLAQSQPPFVAPLWDGVNDCGSLYSASLAAAFNGGEVTIAWWFKMNSVGVWADGIGRRMIYLQADNNNRFILEKKLIANSVDLAYLAGGINKTSSLTLSSAEWTHLGLTVSKAADQMKVYINGVQSGATLTGLGTFVGALAAGNTALGSTSGSTPTNPWHGWLAHVAIWNTPLSAAQMAALATV